MPRLPYNPDNPDLFVNREDEINRVRKKAQALAGGGDPGYRTVVFWGHRGSGRSWLLQHLERLLARESSVLPLYIDLEDWRGQPSEDAVAGFITRLRDLWGSLSSTPAPDDPWPDFISPILERFVLVLLLDHVYEQEEEFLEDLEDQVLTWLAARSRVLLVMAARSGWSLTWKTSEIRVHRDDVDLAPYVAPLPPEFTKEQLERLEKEDEVEEGTAGRAEAIHEETLGYPLANYLFASLDEKTKAIREIVADLLKDVPAEERAWLEVLCPLRRFDEERIEAVLGCLSSPPGTKKAREVLRRLLRTGMVHWSRGVEEYAMDECLRRFLQAYVRQWKPNLWTCVHETARALYQELAEEARQAGQGAEADRWFGEAAHHEAALG